MLHAKQHELKSATNFASRSASPLNPTLPPWMVCPTETEGWLWATNNSCENVFGKQAEHFCDEAAAETTLRRAV